MSVFNHPSKTQARLEQSVTEEALDTGRYRYSFYRIEIIFMKNVMKIRRNLPVNSNVSLKRTFSCE